MKREKLYDGDTFEHGGQLFNISIEQDCDCDMPWENDEGCGIVRRSNHPHHEGKSDKKPGERPLNSSNRNEYQFYFDWQATMQKAKRDKWNTAPYDAPNPAARAVEANFQYLRAFFNDDWQYVVVTVTRLDADGESTGESESLGMVETWKDYYIEVAHDLAHELITLDVRNTETVNAFYAGL